MISEATWKRENDWRRSYPEWFVYALLNLEDEILLRGVEFVTPKKFAFELIGFNWIYLSTLWAFNLVNKIIFVEIKI